MTNRRFLHQLEVTGFKSIEHTDIDLFPLSIVVGANSSGKSTLLQIILALSQAIRSGSADTRFPLNGEYSRFGTFDETVHFGNLSEGSVREGLEILVRTRFSVSIHRPAVGESSESGVKQCYIDWHMTLGCGPDRSAGVAELYGLELHAYTVEGYGRNLDLFRCILNFRDATDDEITDLTDDLAPRRHGGEVRLTPTTGVYVDHYSTGHSISQDCDATELLGSVPMTVYWRTTLLAILGRKLWSALQHAPTVLADERDKSGEHKPRPTTASQRVVDEMVKAAADIVRRFAERVYEHGDRARGVRDPMWEFSLELYNLLEGRANGSRIEEMANVLSRYSADELLGMLEERLGSEPWADQRAIDTPDDWLRPGINWISRNIANFFSERIKYLGPLRKAPQVLYDPRQRDLDIGISGEYTAAVLHMYASHQVTPIGAYTESSTIDLLSGVKYWLGEFGMATKLDLEDRGRLGIGLRIAPGEPSHLVDLTSVGVGVSQVLPVVVLCLLSSPGDLIILEQPELHLHPALQQRLGDFLLEAANSGRQLLVETHSEHLVSRVRRRVAEETGWAEGLVGLLFAEQVDGVTKFRDSAVDRYGGLQDDWPTGFFDISAREAQAFVTTSLTKRYRE